MAIECHGCLKDICDGDQFTVVLIDFNVAVFCFECTGRMVTEFLRSQQDDRQDQIRT